MHVRMISKEEAVAQGSTWIQILAIARFHEKALTEKQAHGAAMGAMPPHKLKKHNSVLHQHRQAIKHFSALAAEMKPASH